MAAPLQLNYTKPKLYRKQREAIFDPARYSVIEATTKAGKTAGCITWLFEQAIVLKPGQSVWWIAPVYAQAEIAYGRMKRAVTLGGMDPKLFKCNDGDMTVHLLFNDSFIKFKSGEKSDNLYGDDVYAAVIDEASRMRATSWHAVRSTLTHTKGPIRIIGNVRGKSNWMYELARKAEQGAKDMAYHKLTAYDAVAAGILDQAEIDDAKSILPEHVFKELYLAEVSDDGTNPFGYDNIKACVGPMRDTKPHVFGIDVAKSVDFTVITGLDANGNVCYFDRWTMVPWEEVINRLADVVKDTKAFVDSTGVGSPIVEALQKRCSNVEGYIFSAPSKQRLMEDLTLALSQRRIKYPDGPIVKELEVFEYVYTRTGVRYSAPEGLHDDCVMSLALAVHGLSNVKEFIGYF